MSACDLCMDLQVEPPATAVWIATVPMCGARPRYYLCEQHLDDIVANTEDVDLAPAVSPEEK